jgi:Secretion system C-terminal sorting domain
VPNANDFTEFTILGTAPTGTATAQVYFSKGQGGGTLYVDDWCLSQTTLPTQTIVGQQSASQTLDEQPSASQTLDVFENKNGQKNAAISRFSVFPNPTDNVLNIRCLEGKALSTEVTVFNGFGQKVFSQKLEIVEGGDNQLQVGDLPDGIYFLSVPSDSNLTKPTNIRFVVLKK